MVCAVVEHPCPIMGAVRLLGLWRVDPPPANTAQHLSLLPKTREQRVAEAQKAGHSHDEAKRGIRRKASGSRQQAALPPFGPTLTASLAATTAVMMRELVPGQRHSLDDTAWLLQTALEISQGRNSRCHSSSRINGRKAWEPRRGTEIATSRKPALCSAPMLPTNPLAARKVP
ncbi:unnamed protein product [Ectocarpus sp. 12 AP-2014]